MHELDALNLTVNTGFPTAVPLIDDFRSPAVEAGEDLDRVLDSLVVPNFGVVMGEGGLATAALNFASPDHPNRAALLEYFHEEGVSEEMAEALNEAFKGGGSVLAVELSPARFASGTVEGIGERFGAANAQSVGAPRYYDHTGQNPYTS